MSNALTLRTRIYIGDLRERLHEERFAFYWQVGTDPLTRLEKHQLRASLNPSR